MVGFRGFPDFLFRTFLEPKAFGRRFFHPFFPPSQDSTAGLLVAMPAERVIVRLQPSRKFSSPNRCVPSWLSPDSLEPRLTFHLLGCVRGSWVLGLSGCPVIFHRLPLPGLRCPWTYRLLARLVIFCPDSPSLRMAVSRFFWGPVECACPALFQVPYGLFFSP